VQDSETRIVILVPKQLLQLWEGHALRWEVPVSTSKHGVGCEEGSHRTPPGRFRICEKVGAGAPPWAVFKGRRWTGEFGDPQDEKDQILSRILWLDGLEEANANTRDRYVYLHGTNAEAAIGQPASIGCVRLRNDDMITLFDRVSVGTEVEIVPG